MELELVSWVQNQSQLDIKLDIVRYRARASKIQSQSQLERLLELVRKVTRASQIESQSQLDIELVKCSDRASWIQSQSQLDMELEQIRLGARASLTQLEIELELKLEDIPHFKFGKRAGLSLCFVLIPLFPIMYRYTESWVFSQKLSLNKGFRTQRREISSRYIVMEPGTFLEYQKIIRLLDIYGKHVLLKKYNMGTIERI